MQTCESGDSAQKRFRMSTFPLGAVVASSAMALLFTSCEPPASSVLSIPAGMPSSEELRLDGREWNGKDCSISGRIVWDMITEQDKLLFFGDDVCGNLSSLKEIFGVISKMDSDEKITKASLGRARYLVEELIKKIQTSSPYHPKKQQEIQTYAQQLSDLNDWLKSIWKGENYITMTEE